MMKLFSKSLSQEPTLKNIFDGPYVFYKNDSVEIYAIENNVALKSHPDQLFVRFSNHPDWDFSLSLKEELSVEKSVYNPVENIFVLSDIEGEFAAFRRLLISNNIIDKEYNWIFGKGHLVINGDMFDRGDEVTSLLWLIYKLENEAKQYGGYVHTIIGNHEVMNLSGDLRYVDEKYFHHAHAMNKNYMQLFDENTELGRWIRSKNVMEKIGDLLFVHGGVSPAVNNLKLSIEAINRQSRTYYDKTEDSKTEGLSPLQNRDSPYWYRGYFREPFCTEEDIDNTLRMYECKYIIVGHTINADRNPGFYFNGKVLNIDVNQHAGVHYAVLTDNDQFIKTDDKGNKKLLTAQNEV